MTVLYSKVRNELKTGDLVAWKVSKIGGFFDFILYLYHKIFGAEYVHVGTVYNTGDRVYVIEAIPPAVRIFPLSMRKDFYLIQTNIESTPNRLNVQLEDVGKKYSLFDMVKGIFNLARSSDSYYCSEETAKYYKEIGYIDDEDYGQTPDTLVNHIIKKYGIIPVFVIIDKGNFNDI